MTWPAFGHTLSVISRVLAVTLLFVPLFVLGLSLDSSAVLVVTQVLYTVAVVAVLFHQVVNLIDERLADTLGSESHSPTLSGRFADPDEDALTHDTPLAVVETAVDLHGDERVPNMAFELLLHSSSPLSVDDLTGAVLGDLDAVDAEELEVTIVAENLDQDALGCNRETDLGSNRESEFGSNRESEFGTVVESVTLEKDTLEGMRGENAIVAVSDPETDTAPLRFLAAPEDGDWQIVALG